MQRITSIEAWRDIEKKLSRVHRRVFNLVGAFQGSTANELEVQSEKEPAARNPHIHKRLSELEDSGYITTGAARRCKVSGRNCLTWWIARRDEQQPLELTPKRVKGPTRKRLLGVLEVTEQYLAGKAGVELLATAVKDARERA